MRPEISVVIPTYNRSELLTDALSSIKNQDFERWEVVIVDDHSTEDIQNVVNGFHEPRFRYVRNKGERGIGSSRNFGNRQALAPLIAVADSDDISLPHRLGISVAYFRDHPETDVFYGNVYMFEDGTYNFRHYPFFAPYSRRALYDGQFIPHASTTYRKEVILEYPYDESLPYSVDYDMFLSLADRNKVFGFTTEPLYLWRFHQHERASTNKKKDLANNISYPIKERHLPFRDNPITERHGKS